MLRDMVSGYLADHYAFDQRKAALEGEPGWRPDIWKAFAQELGILGAPFSEALGGLGGGPVETMIIMEAFGQALVVEPYLGTVVIGGGFLRHSRHPRARELVGEIIDGRAIFAFAYAEPDSRYNLAAVATTARKDGDGYVLNGRKSVVVGAPYATHLIVTARTGGAPREAKGLSVFIVPKGAAGVTTQDYPTVDGFRASDVFLENARVGAEGLLGPEGEALPLVETVVDEAIVATCAEGVGVLRGLQAATLEFTRHRRQFGQPISGFQVLQHRMVNMFMQLEQAVSMTYMATLKTGEPSGSRAAAAAAKAQVGKACRFVGQNAVQLHGGMGVTDEMAVAHYFKRATMIEAAFGSTDHHLARYEQLSFD